MSGATSGLTSVIVVAADSGDILGACVDGVLASTAPVELILVDNASGDAAPARAMAAHGGDVRLRLLANAANIGFGPACNRGAGLARGDALLFLNPDCLIETDTIARLREDAAADPLAGLVGVDVRDADGRPARGNRRREPTLRRALMTLTGLARFEARWPALGGIEMPGADAAGAPVEAVEAVSGACLFLPRAVFDAVGGFDEGYFLHGEDLDLCRRVRDAGRHVVFARGIAVLHHQGSSSRRRPLFVSRHKHRGMWRYFSRYDPAARNPWLRRLIWCGIWLHFALGVPARILRRRASTGDASNPRPAVAGPVRRR
jgi:GT2 family glycosyltransferase